MEVGNKQNNKKNKVRRKNKRNSIKQIAEGKWRKKHSEKDVDERIREQKNEGRKKENIL